MTTFRSLALDDALNSNVIFTTPGILLSTLGITVECELS